MKPPIKVYREIFSYCYTNEEPGFSDLKAVLIVILSSIKHFILQLFANAVTKNHPKEAIWCIVSSKNNYAALVFLKEYFSDEELYFINTSTKELVTNAGLPIDKLSIGSYKSSWLSIPRLFKGLYRIYGSIVIRRFDQFFKTLGVYENFCDLLTDVQPRAIIFANDTLPRNRAILVAAMDHGVKTIYIQHASVTKSFPELKFDLSLLEGTHSEKMYTKDKRVFGNIELIGMPKADVIYKAKNNSPRIDRIGVCPTLLDEKKTIVELVHGLVEAFHEKEISFRKHPRDKRIFNFHKENVLVNPDESAIDFLGRQDLIIGGDSSIHLEALLGNVSTLYYNMNEYTHDTYGYVANEVVCELYSINQIIKYIRENQLARKLDTEPARYYNAVIGTKYEGRSGELAVMHIKRFISEN